MTSQPAIQAATSIPAVSKQHRAAREYCAADIPVFVCEANGKRPATPNGFYDATTDINQIDAWYKENPNFNLAICPANIGLLVVDIDPGADLSILEKLPRTRIARTPRKGTHHYFEGVGASTVGKIAKHVDSRSIGGYVLVPPSVVNGVAYEWENEEDYAPIPDWIKTALRAANTPQKSCVEAEDLPVNVARVAEFLKDCVKNDRVSVVGCGGDATCYEVCCEVLDLGVSVEKAAELLDEYWNPHCRPRQWDYDKLLLKLNNAARYKQNENGCYALRPSEEAFAGALANLSVEKEKSTALHSISLSELLARPVGPVQELIAGILEKRIATILSAPGGSHKSRLLLQWGLCVGTGARIFGRDAGAATFIYLSYEDHADEVTRRAQAIAKRLNLPNTGEFQYLDLTISGRPLISVTENGIEELHFGAELRAHLLSTNGHKFLGIDSIYNALQFHGQAKINEGSVKAAIEWLNRLCAETDTTILALWHPSQSGQERGDASGWSVAWHNTPRARLSLSAVKDIKDAFELRCEKRNNAAKGDPITLRWSAGALLPDTELDAAKEGSRLLDACTEVALMAANNGQPFQKQPRVLGWALKEIEKRAGFRPTNRQIKEELATAMYQGRLRYIAGSTHTVAGYYPPNFEAANDLARQAKRTAKEETSNV